MAAQPCGHCTRSSHQVGGIQHCHPGCHPAVCVLHCLRPQQVPSGLIQHQLCALPAKRRQRGSMVEQEAHSISPICDNLSSSWRCSPSLAGLWWLECSAREQCWAVNAARVQLLLKVVGGLQSISYGSVSVDPLTKGFKQKQQLLRVEHDLFHLQLFLSEAVCRCWEVPPATGNGTPQLWGLESCCWLHIPPNTSCPYPFILEHLPCC